MIKKTYELICKYNRKETTTWGSFDSRIVNKCQATDPTIPRYFSVQKVIYLVVLNVFGFLPFVYLGEKFFEIPCFSMKQAKKSFSWKVVIIVAILNWIIHNRLLFWHFHKRGIRLFAWTLNEESDFIDAFGKGFDGIMTDCPHKLSTFLENHFENLLQNN